MNIFFMIVFIMFLVVGKWLGWSLYKNHIYHRNKFVGFVVLLLWVCLVAILVRYIIITFNLGLISKIIFYGAGGYVSTMNYGLGEHGFNYKNNIHHGIFSLTCIISYIILSVSVFLISK